MRGFFFNRFLTPVIETYHWSFYWRKLTDKVLFFGQTINISDGKLYNEMIGSSDYLTVTGTAGSYTFECPDTSDYSDADTDTLWFSEGSPVAVTEADLVGYDYSSTPVKYDDSSPNTIRAIMIFKAGAVLTADELNWLHRDMRLWMFWTLLLNAYGYLKDNRPLVSVPVPVSAEVTNTDRDKVVITYNQALDETSVSATTAFALAGKTISDVDVDGANVILTVDSSYEEGDAITVDYTKPVVNMIKSLLGGYESESFVALAVTNNILWDTFTLTKTGDGSGVATFAITVSSNIKLRLDGVAKFYSDSGGTADESTEWLVTSGALRTRYIRCSTGIANLKCSDLTKITTWGAIVNNGWVSALNAPAISGNGDRLISLITVWVSGTNLNVKFTTAGISRSLQHFYFVNGTSADYLIGDVADLPVSFVYMVCNSGSTNLYGDIKYLPINMNMCRLSFIKEINYTAGRTWNGGADYVTFSTVSAGYGLSQTEQANFIIDISSATWIGSKRLSFVEYNVSMADTTQGGIWGDFSGIPAPSPLATAYKTLKKTILSALDLVGIVVPGVSGDGTGFPAGFGDWYRS